MKNFATRTRFLSIAIGAALVASTGAAAAQQSDTRVPRRDRAEQAPAQKPAAEAAYPSATREEPAAKTSGRTAAKLQDMVDLSNEGKTAEAVALAEEVLGSEKTSAYEQAIAAQVAAQAAYEQGDVEAASGYFAKVIELDALDNNNHYAMMLNLAQLQQQQGKIDEALATYERFFEETGSEAAEPMMFHGQALLQAGRSQEAVELMERAIASSESPKPEWQAVLMQAHAESGNATGAVQMAEQVAAARPDDKRAQLNLAAVYQQAGMGEKSAEVLEQLRTSGQLSEAAEYQQLYATYLNLDGHEQDAIDVINEGLDKGALEPGYNAYVALGQAYYFSDQTEAAIDAYRKAAPLDDDGGSYLNLAKILLNEGRNTEAREAASQALEKGIDNPEEAKSIMARPGG